MVGKNTFLHGQHETRQARMVNRVELSDDEWNSIEQIILENKIRFELNSEKHDPSQIQKLIPVISESKSIDEIYDPNLRIKLLIVKADVLRSGGNQITEDMKCFINKQYKLSSKEWQIIETDLSKKIVDDKLRNEINHRLSMIAHYRKEYFYKNVNLQDIKRSLSAITKLSEIQVVDAIKKLDAFSIAYIDAEIWRKYKVLSEYATGSQIIEAAGMALQKLPTLKGGKPLQSHNEDIAKLAQEIWEQLGCHGKAYATEDEGSDLTRFANILFEKINGFSDPSGTSKIIRKINK